MKVSRTNTALHNGVSQQPPSLRLESQCEVEENCMSTLVDGTFRRYPTEFVAKLNSGAAAGCLLHTINRDATEQYQVIFTGSATEPIEVFTITGTKKVVKYGRLTDDLTFTEDNAIKTYLGLSGGLPSEHLRAVTISDYTLVLNNLKVVANDATEVAEPLQNVAMVYVKSAINSAGYTIAVNGISYTYTAGATGVISTDSIAAYLSIGIDNAVPNLTVRRKGNVVLMYFPDNREFALSTTDSYGDNALIPIKGEVSAYTKLPPTAFGEELVLLNGGAHKFTVSATTPEEYFVELLAGGSPSLGNPDYIKIGATKLTTQGVKDSLEVNTWAYDAVNKTVYLRVEGDVDPDTVADPIQWAQDDSQSMRVKIVQNAQGQSIGYYVKYENGNWTETRGWGLKNKVDPLTMPHRLVRMADGSFVFAPCLWDERKVGDEDTCPTPSFFGQQISNLVFHRNRLGFLSKDAPFFTRAGEYFKLWPQTAMEVLDDDPIDVQANTTQVTTFREAIPFNRNLLLRSDAGQFILHSGDAPLTPKSVVIDPTTTFGTIPGAVSASVGSNAYFACPNGNYLSVREYFVQPNSSVDDAADVTVHLPHYIPTGNIQLLGCSALDLMFGFNPSDPRSVYAYKYFWAGDQKAQSAWMKWSFNHNILGASLLDSSLYLLLLKGTDVCLERIKLAQDFTTGLDFKVRLDGLVSVAGVHSAGVTTWTLPYTDSSTAYQVIDCASGLRIPDTSKIDATHIIAEGDYSESTVAIGRTYKSTWEPSTWFLRDAKGNAMVDGALKHKRVMFTFDKSGYFEIHVIPKGRATIVNRWRSLQAGLSLAGVASLQKGNMSVSALGRNDNIRIQIVSESHLPFYITGVTNTGVYTIQSKSV
jgi:hypothetical protein